MVPSVVGSVSTGVDTIGGFLGPCSFSCSSATVIQTAFRMHGFLRITSSCLDSESDVGALSTEGGHSIGCLGCRDGIMDSGDSGCTCNWSISRVAFSWVRMVVTSGTDGTSLNRITLGCGGCC